MNIETVKKAAAQFGKGEVQVESLGSGLIHRTYKVTFPDHLTIVLQCLNHRTFPLPENIISNYRIIYEYLLDQHPGKISIPELIKTLNGKYLFQDEEGNVWRATQFMHNSYTPAHTKNEKEIYLAAKSFGTFTSQLAALDAESLHIILPDFHNLQLRYKQFEEAVSNANLFRSMRSTHLIAEMRERKHLLDLHRRIIEDSAFKVRVMHHDCKISNVLFDEDTGNPICPVDLDTTMPGYFFSDFGDMVRSMTPTEDENSTKWEAIDIVPELYEAAFRGYVEETGNIFTEEEKLHLHSSGLILTFMQTLRFLTDYLNNDIYYLTTHAEQNLHRALNQLILLQRLEEFLRNKYGYDVYPINDSLK